MGLIELKLSDNKAVTAMVDNYPAAYEGGYRVIAGEQNATKFRLVYGEKYADYAFSVDMVNSFGYGMRLEQTDIVGDEFVLPTGMATAGYGLIGISAVDKNNPQTVIKWENVKIKVWNSIPDWKNHIGKNQYATVAQFDMLLNKINGVATSLYFDTLEDFQSYVRDGVFEGKPNINEIAGGTTFYIIEQGVPDYWWDDENKIAYELETKHETLSVGNTTTLPAGSSATVTDRTGSPNHIFDFAIPQGIQGGTGAQGTGISGIVAGQATTEHGQTITPIKFELTDETSYSVAVRAANGSNIYVTDVKDIPLDGTVAIDFAQLLPSQSTPRIGETIIGKNAVVGQVIGSGDYSCTVRGLFSIQGIQGIQGKQGEKGRPVFLYTGAVQKMSDGAYVLISGQNYWSPYISGGLHSGDIIIYTYEGVTYVDSAQGIGSTDKWQVQQDRLGTRITGNDGASVDTSAFVTTDTEQLISGAKRFAKGVTVGDSLTNIKYGSGGIERSITSGKVTNTYNAYLPAKTGMIALDSDVTTKLDKSAFSLSGTTLTIIL